MMRGLLVFILLLATGVVAAEIFRWTDDTGQVHYGERPPDDRAQRLAIPGSRSAAPGAVPDETQRRARQQRLLEAFEYERERKATRQAQDAEQARQRAVRCERLRRHWRRLSYAGPIYSAGEDGERRYLDDAERAAQKDRLRPAYQRACGEAPD